MVDELKLDRCGVFANEWEQGLVREMIETGGHDIAAFINQLAALHSLPEIPSGYGLLIPPGEFVKPATYDSAKTKGTPATDLTHASLDKS